MKKHFYPFLGAALLALVFAGNLSAESLRQGQTAPGFSLKDLSGKTYDPGKQSAPMLVLYFFDPSSRPSQEGLLSLDALAQKYANRKLTVWGVTASSQQDAQAFQARTKPDFPVLLDTAGVSDSYGAKMILPTVCILGPELSVLDTFQGGGKTTEMMLVRLAERTLQAKDTLVAKAITDAVISKNPQNADAKAVKGYAEMKDGNLAGAEKIFTTLSTEKGEGEISGKEGLAAVYARKGDAAKAMILADEVTAKAPNRSAARVVKADLLYARNQKAEAEAQYREAAKKGADDPLQTSVALNKLGRIQADAGKYQEARTSYDQAVAMDPYYVEATSNKGRTYEKEGNLDGALSEYRKAQTMDKADTFSQVLVAKTEELIALQKDSKRSEQINALVKDLAERYRAQKKEAKKDQDTWTSRPMILSFIDFAEKGGLPERDGYGTVMTTKLAEELNASGRVKVVDRAILDKLLTELNLGSSELADPQTALSLGQVLAAKLMATGALLFGTDGTLLSLRLVDTETSAIPKVITKTFTSETELATGLHELNRDILKTVMAQYPLKGFLAQADGDRVMLNIGQNQGVVSGTRFAVVEDGQEIEYKGRKLKGTGKTVGELEIVSVEPDLSYARIIQKERALKQDDKVMEKIDVAAGS